MSQDEQLKRALAIIDKLQARLEQVQSVGPEPVAVVGMACRFPGADTPEAYWNALCQGHEMLREVPGDRWDQALHHPDPHQPGKICFTRAGFLDQVDGFDARFFGISPREAEALDPQQRLLLEVTWEALERAGIRPESLYGSQSGVFVGVGGSDYSLLRLYGGNYEEVQVYDGTGNHLSFASGRISYALGLHGPSLNLVTACSSSLVGVHLAAQSLQSQECDLAICAGVNLMLAPDNAVFLSRTQAVSPSGRCRTFDAAADGFVRAEGCGVVLLKRLSSARRDGNRVLAILRASGVNNDGPSAGFTAPNGEAQRRLLSQVLRRSGARPDQVGYLECHGTATVLGDPIEVDALSRVYATPGRPAPLLLGSVKANIGHAEAAAGVAGMIKAIKMLEHQWVPPQIHFDTPNPNIAWDQLPLAVSRQGQALPAESLIGVSSFGMSGTNAHLLLGPGEAPVPLREQRRQGPHLLVLSARSPEALRQLADRYRKMLPQVELEDLCGSAATRRDAAEYRLALVASDRQELDRQLAACSVGQTPAGAYTGRKPSGGSPRVAFLLTGQGSQAVGMGLDLLHCEPAFSQHFAQHLDWLRPLLPRPLEEVLLEPESLTQTAYAQPALVALELALASMWRAWGVEPSALLGHSVGELSAAALAGVFEPRQVLRLAARRGQRFQELAAGGVMTVVWAEARTLEGWLEGSRLSLAAVNGPELCVVSGAQTAMLELEARLDREQIRHRRLNVSHAFHSELLDPALDGLRQDAAEASPQPPRLAMISNLTGDWAGAELAEPDYWARQARGAVQFLAGMRQLESMGIGLYLELGPRPSLLSQGQHCVDSSGAAWVPSLRPQQPEALSVQQALAQLFVAGVDINWTEVWRHRPFQPIDLPTYPWQRQRFWLPVGQRRSSEPQPQPQALPLPAYALNWKARPPLSDAGPARDWRVVGPDAEAVAALAGRLRNHQPEHVVYLASDLSASGPEMCAELAQIVAGLHRAGRGRLWILTRMGVSATASDPAPLPSQSALWGFGRALALEMPQHWGGLLDVAEDSPEAWASALAQLDDEDEMAFRSGICYIPRLQSLELTAMTPQLDPQAFYLVTGASGLALEAAHYLLDAGARRLLLISRSSHHEPRLEQLHARGAEIRHLCMDVVEPRLAQVVAELGGPLKGIVHSAAVLADGLLAQLGLEQMERVFHPKLEGGRNLARAAQGQPLDFFLLFSSAAALFGNLGQANYCAANAALEGLAAQLRAQQVPASVIHWGPWEQVGMVTRLSLVHQQRIREQGLEPFLPQQMAALLSLFLVNCRQAPVSLALLQVDWTRFADQNPQLGRRPILGQSLCQAVAPPILQALQQADPEQRRPLLLTHVRGMLAEVLRLSPDAPLDTQEGFFQMGMDSLLASELAVRLQKALDCPLPTSVILDTANLRQLTDELCLRVFGEPEQDDVSEEELAALIGSKFDSLLGG